MSAVRWCFKEGKRKVLCAKEGSRVTHVMHVLQSTLTFLSSAQTPQQAPNILRLDQGGQSASRVPQTLFLGPGEMI